MNTWRCAWSMVGKWLVYVPNPDGGEVQIALPAHMEEEARKLAAADEMLEALILASTMLPIAGDIPAVRRVMEQAEAVIAKATRKDA